MLAVITAAGLFAYFTWPALWPGRVLEGPFWANVGYLFVMSLLSLIQVVALTARWRVLLRVQGIAAPRRTLLGAWFRGALPAAWCGMTLLYVSGRLLGASRIESSLRHFLITVAVVGVVGALYRWLESGGHTRRWGATLYVSVLGRLLGLVAFAVLFALLVPPVLLSSGLAWGKLRLSIMAMAMLIPSGCIVAALLSPRLLPALLGFVPMPAHTRERTVQVLLGYAGRAGVLAKALAWGFLAHVAWLLMLFAASYHFMDSLAWLRGLRAGVLANFDPLVMPVLTEEGLRAFARAGADGTGLTLSSRSEVLGSAAVIWLLAPGAIGLVMWVSRLARCIPPWRGVWTCTIPPESRIASLEERRQDRRYLAVALYAGLLAGLIGGAIAGVGEAGWCYHRWLHTGQEFQLFYWAPFWYGLVFLFYGAGLGLLIGLACVAVGRYRRAEGVFSAALGLTLASTLVVIGRFRYARDVLGEQPLALAEIVVLLTSALVLAVVVERVGSWLLARVQGGPRIGLAAALMVYAALTAGGFMAAKVLQPSTESPATLAAPPAQGPNIIFIVADTLRAKSLGMHNPAAPCETPAIDAFARDAVRYDKAFSQGSWTKPSFGSLFTGRHPAVHGALGKNSVMPPEQITIAERLTAAGYWTQGFPNNRNLLPEYGLHQGFLGYEFLMPNLYFGATFSSEALTLYQVLRRARIVAQRPRVDVEHFYQPAEHVTDRALAWLDDRPAPNAPFFLFMQYMDPHDPYMLPDRRTGHSSVWLSWRPEARWLEALTTGYHADIVHMDTHWGRFLAGLRERDLYEDTLIIFTSDHGEELYEHGGWYHGETLYDEVTHVPLIIRYPGGPHAGHVVEGLVRHIDLVPAILRVAGLPVPADLPGTPLVHEAGLKQETGPHSFAQTDLLGVAATSVRTAGAKLIYANPDNPRGLPPVAFFDLTADPGEMENLAGTGDPRKSALATELNSYSDE